MMVYAYVHRITEFGENEPSVQVFSSVFVWNTVAQIVQLQFTAVAIVAS